MPTWRIADASPSAVSACVSCVHEEAHRTEYRRTLHAGRALHPEWPRWVWSNRETSRADKCARALVALSPSSTVYTLEYSTYRVSNEPRWLKRDVVLHGQAEGVRRRRIPSCNIPPGGPHAVWPLHTRPNKFSPHEDVPGPTRAPRAPAMRRSNATPNGLSCQAVSRSRRRLGRLDVYRLDV